MRSTWTFSEGERADVLWGATLAEDYIRTAIPKPVTKMERNRRAAVAREQNALKRLEDADPEFARRITAKLIPDPEEKSVTVRWTP